jgi:hypothetical protein
VDDEGWNVPWPSKACRLCKKGEPCGIKYKLGGTVTENVDAEREYLSRPMPPDPPPPAPAQSTPEGDVCAVCGEVLKPGVVTVPTEDGGIRHAQGSPACSRPYPRPAAVTDDLTITMITPEEEDLKRNPVTGDLIAPGPPVPEPDPEVPDLDACPTCGRPVVEGAPYDLPSLRKALLAGLAALDAIESGAKAEEEAREELEEFRDAT